MKKIMSVLLAMVMVVGFSPLALADNTRLGVDVTSATTADVDAGLVRTDASVRAETRTTNDRRDSGLGLRVEGSARATSDEGREREARIQEVRSQTNEQIERACTAYSEARDRYERAREAYAQASVAAQAQDARATADLRVRLDTAHAEYLRARDACEAARDARDRSVRDTISQAQEELHSSFEQAREQYGQARERYGQARDHYAQVRARASEGAREELGPARERYEDAREGLEQARVRYEAALNARTNVRVQEALSGQEAANERYHEARERYEDARVRAQLGIDTSAQAQAQVRYEEAREARERAMRESIDERRTTAQERYEDARERYEDARNRVAGVRERLVTCDAVGLCDEERRDLQRDATPFLTAGADVVVEAIEQVIIRIEASNMPEEQKQEHITMLNARINAILDVREQASSLDEQESVERVEQTSRQLREEWVEARKEVEVSQGIEVSARLRHVHDQLSLLGNRLEQAIVRLEAQGHDVSAAAELMAEYERRLSTANQEYEAAVQAYTRARAAGDFDTAAQQANEYIRQAHAELTQARELLREIVGVIRGADATIDLSAQADAKVQV